MELTEGERAMLDFERSWWTEPGPKDVAINERLEMSTTRYHELLNELIDRPEAEDHDPLVVRRLRRMRDRRRRSRAEHVGATSEEAVDDVRAGVTTGVRAVTAASRKGDRKSAERRIMAWDRWVDSPIHRLLATCAQYGGPFLKGQLRPA